MATTSANPANFCLHKQAFIQNQESLPDAVFEQHGIIEALFSAENTRGFTQLTDSVANSGSRPVAGQTPNRVEIKRRKPSCQEVNTTEADLCADAVATVDPFLYDKPTVNKIVSLTGTVTKEEFDDMCGTPNQWRDLGLQDMARDLKRAMATIFNEDIYALMGDYADG